MFHEYQLVDYFDVWGNGVDGYEVNNICKTGHIITISENTTDKEIIDYLKYICFLSYNANEENIRVEWLDESFIELSEFQTDFPLGRLERI